VRHQLPLSASPLSLCCRIDSHFIEPGLKSTSSIILTYCGLGLVCSVHSITDITPIIQIILHQHTHTHTTVLLLVWNMSELTRVSRYQKGKTKKVKTNLYLLEQEIVSGSGICWVICKSAPHPRQPRQNPTTQFFTDRMPFLTPNQQCQSTEGTIPPSLNKCISIWGHYDMHQQHVRMRMEGWIIPGVAIKVCIVQWLPKALSQWLFYLRHLCSRFSWSLTWK